MDSIIKILDTSMKDLQDNRYQPYCANYAADSIIWNFAKDAKEHNIHIFIEANIPNEICVSSIDLCILLGNLIENGMEACCRQTTGKRFWEIRAAKITENSMAISVKNSYEGELSKNETGFLSSKRPGQGIGIKSVCHIAEKNGGFVKIEYAEGIFQTQVLLNRPQP